MRHPIELVRAAGLSAAGAGLCYVLVGLFHPANVAASVTTTRWEVVHVLACAMCVLGLLGVAGLHVRQAGRTGRAGLLGYVLLSVWFAVVLGFSFVEAFVLPHVASTSPGFVTAWMGMFNGPAGAFDLGVLPTLWTVTGVAYLLGGLLFGVTTFRAGVLPRWAGALLAASTALAPVAALLPDASQPKTAVPCGVALVWLGLALFRGPADRGAPGGRGASEANLETTPPLSQPQGPPAWPQAQPSSIRTGTVRDGPQAGAASRARSLRRGSSRGPGSAPAWSTA